jgi:hypothetical protein
VLSTHFPELQIVGADHGLKLRKLDLNKGAPRQLFVALTNRAPNLKYLKFGVMNDAGQTIRPAWQSDADMSRPTRDLHPMDTGVPILSRFLASVTALQELNFETYDYGDFMKALPVMLECQRYNLKRLDITCGAWGMKAWKPEQIVEVLRMVPELEFLKAQMLDDIVDGKWMGVRRGLDPWGKYDSAVKTSAPRSEGMSGISGV